ncbi:cell division/cell wall cluster transcriptional repressor MraZ [Photobacterium jeanii]|uniref:Transcriptional regulator MraZ n=1 Tax=Photobacterium jeanii TaxID=858640 RepID=A0A178KHU4_9GAMM|nr:division/cell wall cluster transcriptional repressor MraZ [Photobacterium jeanii]OAN16565.1 cell division/cell wall cluster transcriptional repressor MraZ [Photobacterium jeanii]PST87957.1 transcriptional regulator MraZ [Photobacterium jeanii]
MLRGVTAVAMDGKGRLAIPKRYRMPLQQCCEGQFVCTIDHQYPCLLLYPLHEWERIEIKLSRLSSFHPEERRLQRLLLGHASECEMDGHGRLLIAPSLRQYAGLDGKVMLVGQYNKFELWHEPQWQQQILQDTQFQAEASATLSTRLSELSL